MEIPKMKHDCKDCKHVDECLKSATVALAALSAVAMGVAGGKDPLAAVKEVADTISILGTKAADELDRRQREKSADKLLETIPEEVFGHS